MPPDSLWKRSIVHNLPSRMGWCCLFISGIHWGGTLLRPIVNLNGGSTSAAFCFFYSAIPQCASDCSCEKFFFFLLTKKPLSLNTEEPFHAIKAKKPFFFPDECFKYFYLPHSYGSFSFLLKLPDCRGRILKQSGFTDTWDFSAPRRCLYIWKAAAQQDVILGGDFYGSRWF